MTELWSWNGNITELLTVALGGLIGALVKDILQDGCFELPYLEGRKLYMGFIGGAIVGAFIGIVIDGSFITATLAGYTGSSILVKLLDSKNTVARPLNLLKISKVKTKTGRKTDPARVAVS